MQLNPERSSCWRHFLSSWLAERMASRENLDVIGLCAMDEDLARVSVIVTGMVQGVFYRASALEQAQSLNLTGWVKNLPDSSVEIVAEGPRYALEQFVDWCRRGPPSAEVQDAIVRWGKHLGEFRTFMIVR